MNVKKTIFIDFDGTITKTAHGVFAAPMDGAIDSIRKLYEEFRIVIYSCRANMDICDVAAVAEMKNYLNKYDIPYHEIKYGKPYYDFIIDDRSLNPLIGGWDKLTQIIQQ